MSTANEREAMAAKILDYEARRDAQGRLQIYDLPKGDGGGTYEVGGINDRFHPNEAQHLAELINAKRFDEAESMAREFIAAYTDFAARWTNSPAIEFYLRDCGFNRGPRGAARILQRALGVVEDGHVGPNTLAAVAVQEKDAHQLLKALRAARERYERDVAKRSEGDKFWKGLVNRWNKALSFAEALLPPGTRTAAGTPPAATNRFEAAKAVIAEAIGTGGGSIAANAQDDNPDISVTGSATMEGRASPASGGSVTLMQPVLGPINRPVTMRALRIGSEGELVAAWQSFLTGQGFDPGGADGHFGEKTAVATRAFQEKHGLSADGIAGRQTMMTAMQLGFELIEEPAADTTGSNFPPRPDFPPLVGTASRQAVFGKFDYVPTPQPGNREKIRILGTWVKDNIVMVEIPQLRAVLGSNAPAGMQFHRLAAEQLKGLWAEWERAGLLGHILTFDGSFAQRFIRGSTTVLSNHAFGSAFDINARWNGLGARPALVGERGCVRELVPIANDYGFYWGGHFGRRQDGMHFEIAHLKSGSSVNLAFSSTEMEEAEAELV